MLPLFKPLTLSNLSQLYALKGQALYGGESLSQLDHGLQCATLAEAANQPNETIVACLLHDMGHLLQESSEDNVKLGVNDHHEHLALPYLRQLFSPAITEPIRLHVQAKQYLCAVDRLYWAGLSVASQQSLECQGGIFSEQLAQAFIAQPYAIEAVQLRRWDDQAKVVGLETPDWQHFMPMLFACVP